MAKILPVDRVARLCDVQGAGSARSRAAAQLADAVYAQTKRLHGLTKTARGPLQLAAALYAGKPFNGAGAEGLAAALPELTPWEHDCILRAVEFSSPDASVRRITRTLRAGDASLVDHVGARMAAVVRIAAALCGTGGSAAALKAVVDDGDAVTIFVRGGDAAAGSAQSGLWNALMARPIRSMAAPDGPIPRGEQMSPGDTVAEAARSVLQRHLEQFMARAYGLRYDEDIEYVHEMRVALRRLRAALRIFGKRVDGLPPELNDELRSCADVLGLVRDQDVFLEFLRAHAAASPAGRQALVRGLLRSVRRKRKECVAQLALLFDSDRYHSLIDTCYPVLKARTGSAGGLRPRDGKGRSAVRREAPGMLRKQLKRVLCYDRRLSSCSTDQLHRLRIECKRLRYAAEAFDDIYPRGLGNVIRPMVNMQRCLGTVHDTVVYAQRVAEYRRRSRARRTTGASASGARALQDALRHARAEAIARGQTVWETFTRQKNRKSMVRMIGAAGRA